MSRDVHLKAEGMALFELGSSSLEGHEPPICAKLLVSRAALSDAVVITFEHPVHLRKLKLISKSHRVVHNDALMPCHRHMKTHFVTTSSSDSGDQACKRRRNELNFKLGFPRYPGLSAANTKQ